MRQQKSLLFEELNRIKEMMGLPHTKPLLIESVIPPGILRLVVSQAGKNADEIARALLAGGKRVSNKTAKELKAIVDDLAIAVRSADDVAVTVGLKNLFGTKYGMEVIPKLVDDITQSSTELLTKLEKRANSLKAQGLTDEAIKTQIKTDIKAMFEEASPVLSKNLQDWAETAVTWSGKGVKKVQMTVDDVFARLNAESGDAWSKYLAKDPLAASKSRQVIQAAIDAGAKTEDEIVESLIKTAIDKTGQSWWDKFATKFGQLWRDHPKKRNVILGITAIGLLGGAKGTAKKVWELFKLVFGSDIDVTDISEEDVDKFFEENPIENENNNENNNEQNSNCPGQAAFEAWAKETFNATSESFSTTTCTGVVMGTEFTWKDNAWQ